MLRKKKKENDPPQELAVFDEDVYADLDLRQAIRQLKEEEQAVIYLRYYEDQPLDEIARITQQKLSTVKSRLYRAMYKLKAALLDENIQVE